MSEHNAADYDLNYWERRYSKNQASFEWFEALSEKSALQQVIDEYLPPPKRLLDIGCGTSRISELLAQQGHAVDAVDNSTEAIRICEERMRADPLPPSPAGGGGGSGGGGSCRFVLADLAAETSYAAGGFDAAVDKGTLDCLDCLGLAPAAAREVHRLVRSGGLLVSVSCRANRESDIVELFDRVHKRDVWMEAGAPCPNHSIHVFRKR